MKRAILLTLMIGVFCTIGRTAVGCEWIEACGVSPAEVCKGTSQLFWGYGKGTLYVWKFGDGQSANAPVISHTYSNPGAFRATFEITDTVKCGHTVRAYVTATAKALTEFSPKPGIFPKCVNAGVSRDDFTITTTPSGYENDVVFSAPDGTSQAGTFEATATYCNEQKTASYSVVGSDVWVPYPSGTPVPPPTGDLTRGPFDGVEGSGANAIKWSATFSGPTPWIQLGERNIITCTSATYVTTVSTVTWGISGSVAGKIEFGVGILKEGGVTITVSGNWEETNSRSVTVGPGSCPYLWRRTQFQQVWEAAAQDVFTWRPSSEPGCTGTCWELSDDSVGLTGPIGTAGLTEYFLAAERKCP